MSSQSTNTDRLSTLLKRGVIADIIPSEEEFTKALLGGERLKIYLGIDPTAPALHLGHAQNVLLLEEFRSLGHEAIILIGDFTATIGDPTGRSNTRAPLSQKEVEENSALIVKQLEKILDFKDKENPARIEYNSSWLRKLTFTDVLALSSNFTVQQILERDMFEKRIKNTSPIFLHEFLYPLMQGYDSVALDVDVELGGTDQMFNMLAGRTLLKKMKNKEKFVVTTTLIENPATGELMSKSLGTGVFINTSPEELFGQIMAQPDEMMHPLLIGTTRLPLEEVTSLTKKIAQGGKEARDAKFSSAEAIVSVFHSPDDAKKAREAFISIFSEGNTPESPKEVSWDTPKDTLVALLIGTGLSQSKTEARRLISEGAVEIDEKVQNDPEAEINLKDGVLIRVGKRRFVRVIH